MTPRDLFVVLNPAAGRGRVQRDWPRIREALERSGARWQMARSERHGHAVELAERAAREGWSAVVAVGGDGTVHEVANGLLRAADGGPTAAMGVLGEGSGNDFIKMIGVAPRDPVHSVDRIANGEPRQVDVGWVSYWDADGGEGGEQWFFTNGVGLGFDARVAVEAAKVRRLRGMAVYAWGLMKALRDLHTPSVELVVDGVTIRNAPLLLTTVANGGCHGGSFWLAPDAQVDDGLFDILTAEALSLPAVLRILPKVMRGTHLGHPAVSIHRGTRVELRAEKPLPIHADGEIVARGVREMHLELLPGRLTVV